MLDRFVFRTLAIAGLALSIAGCGRPAGLDSIQVSPASQALSVGQTAQLTATGTYGNANHSSTQDITGSVTWSSSAALVASVSPSGLVTAVGAGTTTITASAAAFNGPTSSSASIAVTSSGGGIAGGSVVAVTIVPGSQSVAASGETTQFLAVGTTSSGATIDLTNQVAWNSSTTAIATIGTTGLATAVTKGTTTITAVYSKAGTIVTGNATLTVTGGTVQQYTSVTILPSSETLTSLNQSAQFIALATSGATGFQEDVTNSPQIKWTSSTPTAGSITATGVAKNLAAGTSTITAELTNKDGSVVSNAATLTTSLTAAPQDLLSLTIIPSSITVGNLQDSGQFLAIGTFATAPTIRDLTNLTTWITSAPNVFPVTTNNAAPPIIGAPPRSGSQNGGVVSAYGNGSATIIAEYQGRDNSIQTATSNFACPLVQPNLAATPPVGGSCYPGSAAPALLSTLTVYNEGLNSNTSMNWEVTAPSASGSPAALHCGPLWTANGGTGGSVCTATYPVGTTVTLTAAGGLFGGWSSNCTANPVVPTPTGPNTCTVTLTTDDTVGAIFN